MKVGQTTSKNLVLEYYISVTFLESIILAGIPGAQVFMVP